MDARLILCGLLGFCFVIGCKESRRGPTASTPASTPRESIEPQPAKGGETATQGEASPEPKSETDGDDAAPDLQTNAPTNRDSDIETNAAPDSVPNVDTNVDAESTGDTPEESSPEESSSESDSDSDSDSAEQREPEVDLSNAIRVLLPTTAGPLVMAIDLRVGDTPLQQAFDNRMLQVIEEAGEGDELTWRKLFRHVADDTRQFGRMPVNANQYQNMTRTYDKNRNKRPDPDEVARFLFRNAGFSAPFRLFGSNQFRDVNRSQSALFRAIDTNENRKLEPNEVDAAAQALLKLDRDGDRRIVKAEVVDNELTNDAWRGRRSSRWGEVAMDLLGYIDWTMMAYTLDDSPKQGVFSEQPNVIARLDHDDDGSIASAEAKELVHAKPDIAIQVVYAAKTDGSPKVRLLWVAPSIRENSEVQTREADVSIVGSNLRLLVRATDVGIPNNQIPPEAFAALDANKDGGLDESEIPEGAFQEYSFADLDADGDEKLTLDEIRQGMIPDAPIWGVQIRGRGAEAPDGVFAWLDQDRNEILSEREIIQVVDRLKQVADSSLSRAAHVMADNEQSIVRATQLPDTFELHLTRGDPSQADQLFRTADRNVQASSEAWPRWATSMDTNRDGDISRREFVGSDEQFRKLDRNRDGFVDRDEL